jgi:hypothetical protein
MLLFGLNGLGSVIKRTVKKSEWRDHELFYTKSSQIQINSVRPKRLSNFRLRIELGTIECAAKKQKKSSFLQFDF